MSSKFVLTAQLQLQAPTNVAQVVNLVNKQLQGVKMNINPVVNAKSLSQANTAIQKVGVSANVASKSLNSAAGSAGNLGTALGAAARRFASITLATGFFLALTRAVGSAVGRAIEFEKEMLKISQVTGKSVRGLRDLSSEVTKLSTTLGVSSEELLNVARTLSQAGFAADKVTGALKILAQTDLAATFDNIKDTTEGAVAILSQFRSEVRAAGGEVQFLEKAMDSINSVSKSFAVESSDLISVVRRTGGVFEAAGGKLNELIALFTSVRATTRETADTIATGFRTIFTRIQRSETIDSLRELGIVLQDTEGKFVGPMKAIERLSAGLSALDPRDFRFNEIVEQLGGFRQIGKVIPLIKQYSTSTEALAVANNSMGSTAKDAGIAQQGLGIQFLMLKEKFDATIRTLSNSSTFQTLAQTALKLANSILQVVESLEPLLPMLTALAAFKMGQIALPAIGKFAGVGGKHEGGKIHGFAGGGMVPGRGDRDTVPAALTPGEFVMRKSAVKKIGANNMERMNVKGYASGGVARDHQFGAVVLEESGGIDETVTVPINRGQKYGFKGLTPMINTAATTYFEGDPKGKEKVRQTLDQKIAGRSKTLGVSGIQPKVETGFREGIEEGIIGGINIASQRVASATGTPYKQMTPDRAIEEKFWAQINDAAKGNMFEQVIDNLKGEPYDEQIIDPQRPWDFMGGLGAIGGAFNSAVQGKDMVDAKASRAKAVDKIGMGSKMANQLALSNIASMGPDFEAFDQATMDSGEMLTQQQMDKAAVSKAMKNARYFGGRIGYYAKGGKTDTVPAMLTPGEYVVKKSAAQSIGYSNLHRMNQSNGVNGYAAGGIVGSTRNNYGTMPGGAGGAGINMGPVNSSMMALAESATKVSLQLETLKVTFTSAVDDFLPLQSAIANAATGISAIDDAVRVPLSQGATVLAGALTETGQLFISLEARIWAELNAGAAQFTTALMNASKGMSTIDDVLKQSLVASAAPLKKSIGVLDAEFKKFGTELKTKLAYFDVLKKANTDLLAVMEKLGVLLLEKGDDFNILKPAISALEQSLLGLTVRFWESADDLLPLKGGVSALTNAMTGQAKGLGGGGGMATLSGPTKMLASGMNSANKAMLTIPGFTGQLNGAMIRMVEALNLAATSVTSIGATGGSTSAEMAQLVTRIESLEKKIIQLEGAAGTAAGKLGQTRAPVSGGAMAGGAKGGGGGGAMGNQMMMMAMMAGMVATQYMDLSAETEAAVNVLAMLGPILGMVAAEMGSMVGGAIANTVANWGNTSAKAANTGMTRAESAAKAKNASITGMSTGVFMGLAAAITIVMAVTAYLGAQAKELGEQYNKGIKDLKSGEGSMTLGEAQNMAAKTIEKEAQAAGASFSGWVATIATTAAIVVGAIALFVAGVATGGAAWVAAGVIIAAAGAAGAAAGASFATVGEALAASTRALVGTTWNAVNAMSQLSMANKAIELEQLKGVELMQRQGSAFDDFYNSSVKAVAGLAEFQGMDKTMDTEIKSEMMDSDAFKDIKDGGIEAMRELSKSWYGMASSMKTGMNQAVDEMIEGGMSANEAMNTAGVREQLDKYGKSVEMAARVQLMLSGQHEAQAKRELGLQGVIEAEMSVRQRNLVQAREKALIDQDVTGRAEKAQEAQEKSMNARLEADAKAKKEAAISLAANISLARSAESASMALNSIETSMMNFDGAIGMVDSQLGALSGNIKLMKSNMAGFIGTLSSGFVTPEAEAAATATGASFGIDGQVSDLIGQIKNSEKIRTLLTTKGLTELKGGLDETAASLQLDDFLSSNNIDFSAMSSDVRAEVMKMLKDGLQPDEIGKIMDMINSEHEGQIKILQDLAKAQQSYIGALFKFGDNMVKASNAIAESMKRQVEVQLRGAERMAKARGKTLSSGQVGGAEEQRRNAKVQSLGLIGGGPRSSMIQIDRRREKQQTLQGQVEQAQASGDTEGAVVLQNEQKILANETAALTQNLKELSDQSKLAGVILSEIDIERGKRETLVGEIRNFAFASNKERKEMDMNFMALQRVLATGNLNSIPDEKRGDVRQLLEKFGNIEVARGMTGDDVLKQFDFKAAISLATRGKGRQLTPEEFRSIQEQIFEPTDKEQELIDQLKAVHAEEQQAAAALENIKRVQKDDLVTGIKKMIVELQAIKGALGGKAGEGIDNPVQPAKPKARGGWVRFEEGGGATSAQAGPATTSFAPQGTDTVPAMLTPGEFVVNRKAAQRNAGALQSINNGQVQYLQEGGPVGTSHKNWNDNGSVGNYGKQYATIAGSLGASTNKGLSTPAMQVGPGEWEKAAKGHGVSFYEGLPSRNYEGALHPDGGSAYSIGGGELLGRSLSKKGALGIKELQALKIANEAGSYSITDLDMISDGSQFSAESANFPTVLKGIVAGVQRYYSNTSGKEIFSGGSFKDENVKQGKYPKIHDAWFKGFVKFKEKSDFLGIDRNSIWTGFGLLTGGSEGLGVGTADGMQGVSEWTTSHILKVLSGETSIEDFIEDGMNKSSLKNIPPDGLEADMQKFKAMQELGKNNKNSIPENLRGGGFGGKEIKNETGWNTNIPNYDKGLKWYTDGLGGTGSKDWLNSEDITGAGLLTQTGAAAFANNYEPSVAGFKSLQDQYMLAHGNAMSGPGKFLNETIFANPRALNTLSMFYKRPVESFQMDGLAGVTQLLDSIDPAKDFMASEFSQPLKAFQAGILPNSGVKILESLQEGPLQGMKMAGEGLYNEATEAELGFIPWDILSGGQGKPFDEKVFQKANAGTAQNLLARVTAASNTITMLKGFIAQYAGAGPQALEDPVFANDMATLVPGVLASGLDGVYNAFEGGNMGLNPIGNGVDAAAWEAANKEGIDKLEAHAEIYTDLRNNSGAENEGAINIMAENGKPDWIPNLADYSQIPVMGIDDDGDGVNDNWQLAMDNWHLKNNELAKEIAGGMGGAFNNAGGGPAGMGLLAQAVQDRQMEDRDDAARAAGEKAAEDRMLAGLMNVWWINGAKKAGALEEVLGPFPGANDKSPFRGPVIPPYSKLKDKPGVGANGNPTDIRMVTQIPRTMESFDAMFPYLHALGADTWKLAKQGAISGVTAKDGIQYNPLGIRKNAGQVLPQMAHWATQQPIDWKTKGGKGQNYLVGGDNELKYTGLFMEGSVAGVPKGMKMLSDGVKKQQTHTQNAINAAWKTDWQENGNVNSPFATAIKAAGLQNVPWLFNPGQPGQPQGPAPVRRASGGPIPGGINFQARGTDTVPAMLTPGEFVMKKSAVDKYGMGFMSAINEGRGGSGGYMATGGVASGSVSQFGPQEDLRIDKVLSSTQTTSKTVKEIAGMITNVDSKTTNQQSDLLNSFNTMSEADSALSAQIQSGLTAIFDQRVGLPEELSEGIISDINTELLSQIGTLRQRVDWDHQNILKQSFNNFNVLARAIPAMMRPFNPAGPPQFMATGGMAKGTDTVPAMLTPGEFVMKKSAVDKYGVGFMRGINNGVQGFAKGGPVQYLRRGSKGPVEAQSGGGGGGGGGGFGEMVSSINSSLDAFNQAFLAFSGLSSMLGNIINSISNLNITHTINLQGSLNIPGFSQEAVNSIVSTIAGQTADITNKQIRKALRQRDSDNENKT